MPDSNPKTAHQVAEVMANDFAFRDLNEADTRHQILDRLFHEVLGWPHSAVRCEQHVHAGFMDYILKDGTGRVLLVIEAKREGAYFELPVKVASAPSESHRVRLKTLATATAIKAAVVQVSQYCPEVGSEFACVTNGQAFIFFRTFVRGKSYFEADAFVIPSLSYYSESFTEAQKLLSYNSITKERSLANVLDEQGSTSRELYHPKDDIGHYDAPFSPNNYAHYLFPLARRYFEDITQDDFQMMYQCYVNATGVAEVVDGLTARLVDKMTPFFETDGGQEVASRRDGGPLTQRIAKSLVKEKGDVVILYGGKGAGKSTFLRKLLYVAPPTDLKLHAFPVVVDFLQAPQETSEISHFAWQRLLEGLDQSKTLSGGIDDLAALFADKLDIAQRQELSGLNAGEPEYIRIRNALILKWKTDIPYVSRCLQKRWKKEGKHLIVAFDNTDQLPPKLQDTCFLLAQSIASDLGCVTIISMREERYCRARTMGVLDAYHNAGFHLASPDMKLVFKKRLRYLINDLKGRSESISKILPVNAPFDDLISFFSTCSRQFHHGVNSLSGFLSACSRDNMRLALEFFRQFISSGYTNVGEMVAQPHWTVIDHQVVKPMMIPDRYNYDEVKSLIPNAYQCRSLKNGSHFTGLRILNLLKQVSPSAGDRASYFRVDLMCDDFDSKFGMRTDCEIWLDIFLRHGLIESNNRLDCYSVESTGSKGEMIYADEVRITAFGAYMFQKLCSTFSYLELVSLDTGLSKQSLCTEFCASAIDERKAAREGNKVKRLSSRVRRATKFVEYLREEEQREANIFLLNEEDRLMPRLIEVFQKDLKRVSQSAKRNVTAENGYKA